MLSNLYITGLEENGAQRYGLFYDEDGVRKSLVVDFKPLVYDSREEAQSKLDAMAAERRREDAATAFSSEEAKAFAGRHKGKFASTYAKTAPHEYLVKNRLSEEDRKQFERFVQTINKDHVIGYFYGHENKYLILGDHYYWYMPCYPDNMAVDLINRTTTDYLEYRDGAYYYRGKT